MTVLTLSLILLFGGTSTESPPTRITVDEACPAETEQGRRVALQFATWDAEAQRRARARNGVPRLTGEEVRLLVDGSDRATCQQITAAIQRNRPNGTSNDLPVYYAAGDHYFAVLSRQRKELPPPPSGSVWVSLGGWISLIVLDRDFNIVGSVAM